MSDELEAAINKWSSQALLSAWVILQMPDFDGDGDIVIGEADIEQLVKYIKTADEQMAALLAACEAFVTASERGRQHYVALRMAEAAIARARGEG